MVVCKYFLQGTCRFGNQCNFEHPRSYNNQQPQQNQYNNRNQIQSSNFSNQGYDQNKYKYVANNNNNNNNNNPQPTNLFSKLISHSKSSTGSSSKPSVSSNQPNDPDNITNEKDFLDLVLNDFKAWLNSSFWKLSCYSYNKSAPCLPILTDISPEEVRFSVYEAKKINRYQEEFQQFQQKYQQVIGILNQIANPNKEMQDYLIKYFNESCSLKNISNPPPVNPFMQIIQNKQNQLNQQPQQSLFQTQSNLPIQNFLQNQQTNQIQSSGSFLFTNQNKLPSPPPPLTSNNLFSQIINNNSTSLLNTGTAAAAASLNTKTKNFFNNNSTQIMSNNNNNNQFTIATNLNQVMKPSGPSNFYSNINELNNQDKEEYTNNKFTLGKIPRNAPLQEYCF